MKFAQQLEKLEVELKQIEEFRSIATKFCDLLVQQKLNEIQHCRRQLVGEIETVTYTLEYIWIDDEYVEDTYVESEEDFRYACLLKSDQPQSPITGFSGGRKGSVLMLANGDELESGIITVGWGKTAEEAKGNLICCLAELKREEA